MVRLLVLALLFAGVVPVWAANTLTAGDTMQEIQSYLGPAIAPYVAANCTPAVPGSGLTLDAFACTAFINDASTPARLIPVVQPAAGVGPLTDCTDPCFNWIAIHQDRTTTVASWTRMAGTHYLYRQNATWPANPAGGLVVAFAQEVGGDITGVAAIGNLMPVPLSQVTGETNVQECGILGDNSIDEDMKLQLCLDRLAPGHTLVIPGGMEIGVGNSITLANREDLTIRCEGHHTDQATNTSGDATWLRWNGTNGGTVLNVIRSPGFTLQGCGIRTGAGGASGEFDIAINLDSCSEAESASCPQDYWGNDIVATRAMTNPKLRDLILWHQFSRASAVGVMLSNVGTTNSDFTHLTNVWAQINGGICYQTDWPNAQQTKFFNSSCTQSLTGIYQNGGQVLVDGGVWNNLTTIWDVDGPNGPSLMQNINSESVSIWLDIDGSNGMFLLINNLVTPNASAVSPIQIDSGATPTLVFIRNAAGNDAVTSSWFSVGASSNASPKLVSIGNVYNRAVTCQPWPAEGTNTSFVSRTSLHDTYWSGGGNQNPCQDMIYSTQGLDVRHVEFHVGLTRQDIIDAGSIEGATYWCNDCDPPGGHDGNGDCVTGGNGGLVVWDGNNDLRCD